MRYSLFAVDAALLGHKVERYETLLACAEINDTPPIRFGVIDDLHAVAFGKAQVGLIARFVIIESDNNASLGQYTRHTSS